MYKDGTISSLCMYKDDTIYCNSKEDELVIPKKVVIIEDTSKYC